MQQSRHRRIQIRAHCWFKKINQNNPNTPKPQHPNTPKPQKLNAFLPYPQHGFRKTRPLRARCFRRPRLGGFFGPGPRHWIQVLQAVRQLQQAVPQPLPRAVLRSHARASEPLAASATAPRSQWAMEGCGYRSEALAHQMVQQYLKVGGQWTWGCK